MDSEVYTHICNTILLNSDNLLATTQGSKLPVKKKSSLNAYRQGSGSDVDMSGGSGEDSGFNDASEFALFKLDSHSKS